MRHKRIFCIVSGMFLYMNIIGMEQEKNLMLMPDDILYNITLHCTLRSIVCFKGTCKKYNNNDISNPYYIGRLICGIYKNSYEAIGGRRGVVEWLYEYKDGKRLFKESIDNERICGYFSNKKLCLLKYFAKKADQVMFDFCYNHLSDICCFKDNKSCYDKNKCDYEKLFDDAVSCPSSFSYDLANFLVNHKKENINFDNDKRNKFFFLVCIYGDNRMVKKWMLPGVNVNYAPEYACKNTPLHYAFNNGNVELAKFLMKNGADISHANATGERPFDIMLNNSEFCKLYVSLVYPELLKVKDDENFSVIQNIVIPLTAVVIGGIGCLFFI